MTLLLPDVSAHGALFLRRGDGMSCGTLRLEAGGWRASLNPAAPGGPLREQAGFATTADALAWAAGQPGIAGDLSTLEGAVLFGPGAVLPLTPWDGPHGRLALLLRPRSWQSWAEALFKTRTAPAIVAWRQKGNTWQVAGGLRPEADGRWTVWRIGRRAQTYAGRAGAENALGAHLAEGADSAHQRLALQRLPAEAIDRHEALRDRPPAPVRPATLTMNGRMTLTRGDGALTGTVTAREQGGWHAGWPGPHGGVFETPDAAVAACRPDPDLLPDLRTKGAVQTPLGLMLPLADGPEAPLLAAPLRAREPWAEFVGMDTGVEDGVEALVLQEKGILGILRRCRDGRLRVLVPDRCRVWPRGIHGGRLAKDAAHGLALLARETGVPLAPGQADRAAQRLDSMDHLRRICPKGNRG